MRPFDEKLLDILKTETEIEGRLKREAGFREEFMEEMMSNSQGKNPETYNRFHDKIAIGRMMRYIAWPMHKNNMIQTSFVVNGKMRMQIGGGREDYRISGRIYYSRSGHHGCDGSTGG